MRDPIRKQWYILEATAMGCAAEVYLNDIPIVRVGFGGRKSAFTTVNHFMVRGNNELTIVLNPGPTPAAARTRAPWRLSQPATAAARVARYADGETPGEPGGAEILAARAAPASGAAPPIAPYVAAATADLGAMFGAWSWEASPRIDPQSDGPAIDAVLHEVHEAFVRQDTGALLAMFRLRIDEFTRACALAVGERDRVFEGLMNSWAADGGWKMSPLAPAEYDLRVCAGGRMVECIARDWLPIVRSLPAPDGGRLLVPLYLARVGQSLRIVR